MRIKKIYQGELPENKILNVQSESSTDTYSCDYINNLGVGGGDGLDELPVGSVIRYDGEDIPEGWEEIEDNSGPSAAMASLAENFTATSSNRYFQTVIPLTRLTSAGNKFTLVDNGIKIGPGVSRISMGGQLTTNTQTNGSLYGICLVIYKNGVGTQNRSLWIADNGTYDTRVVMPKIVEVEEGDIVKMEIYIDASGPSITLRADSTYITVEEIPDTTIVTGTTETSKWKLLQANVAAGVNVDISTLEFDELYIEARVGTQTEENANFIQTFHILKAALLNETKYYRHGAYFYTNYNGAAVIEATLTSIKSTDNYFNGKVVNTYTKVDIYYR